MISAVKALCRKMGSRQKAAVAVLFLLAVAGGGGLAALPVLRWAVIRLIEAIVVHRELRYEKWNNLLLAAGQASFFAGAIPLVLFLLWRDRGQKVFKPLRVLLADEVFVEKLLYAFTAANFIIILHTLTYQSIWCDEAFTLHKIQRSYMEIWHLLGTYDVHCPLYFFITKFFVDAAKALVPSVSEVCIAKSVSMMSIALLVVAAMKIVRRNWGNLCGAFFATCVTGIPDMMNRAVEIRMYSWLMLFVTLAFLFAYNSAVRKDKKSYALLTLSAAACCYTHYYGAVSAAGIYLFFLIWLIRHDRKSIKWCILSGITALLLFSPWLIFVVKQVVSVSHGGWWTGKVGGSELVSYIFYPFSFGGEKGAILTQLTALVYAAVMFWRYIAGCKPIKGIYWVLSAAGVYVFTVAVGVLFAWTVAQAFLNRYASQCLPLVWLSLGMVLSQKGRIKHSSLIMIFIALAGTWTGLTSFMKAADENEKHYGDILPLLKSITSDDAIISGHITVSAPIDYMTGDVKIYDAGLYVPLLKNGIEPMLHDTVTIDSYTEIPDVKGNVYFMLPAESIYIDDFQKQMANIPVHHIEDSSIDGMKIKIYMLDKDKYGGGQRL